MQPALARSSAAALSRGGAASHRAGVVTTTSAALRRRPSASSRSLLPFAARGLAGVVAAAAATSTAPAPLAAPGLAPVRRALTGSPFTTSRRGLRSSSVVAHGLKAGIVGLPNVGKSTLFNALCENAKAAAANFPFCTIEPNVGLVTVPDPRLEALSEITKSKAIIPTVVEFVDIAGLVKGAAAGEGLGNQFLANIRECDAIVQVVRCFEDENVIHVAGEVDPTEDAGVINFELALADYAQVEKRLARLAKGGRSRSKEEAAAAEVETAALTRIAAALEAGKPARGVELNEEEAATVRLLQLLTAKPMIYAANVAEGDLADGGASNKHVKAVKALAAAQGCELVVVSAQVEAELRDLEPAEAAEYLADLGAPDGGGLSSLIRAAYEALGLMTYFTTGEKETRAWTVKRGATAPEAAAVIHSSFLKLFIRAEAISYDDFVKHKGAAGAKEAGVQRLEGKDYVVEEGDVLLFRTGGG